MSSGLLKYVAMQLLVLAGSLNEELSKSGTPALPIAFSKPVTPVNLDALVLELAGRLDSVVLAPSVQSQVTQHTAVMPPGKLPPTVVAAPLASPATVAAVPAAPVVPVPPAPHSQPRLKRDVSGVISEVADSIADLSTAVGDSPLQVIPLIDHGSDVVSAVAEHVEEVTKPETTALGEILLSA